MREIKFRAWFNLKNKMVSSDELQLSYDGEDQFDFAFDKSTEDGEGNIEGTLVFELMQYTGLKDKNGTEIYEGDILYAPMNIEGEEFIGIVEWDYENAKFITSGFEHLTNEDCYVKGNIHENPELLEGQSCT